MQYRGFIKKLRQVVDYGGISKICKGFAPKKLDFEGARCNFNILHNSKKESGMETKTLNAKCLCQKVSVIATDVKAHVDSCHCSMCRKWSGGPLLALDCGTQVEFDGQQHISTFSSSDWAERGFCNNCGTHLFYRLKESNQYIMPAGLFDNLEDAEFTTQIFIDEKPYYYDFANQTKMMTGEEVFAAFAGSSTSE
jgi:hypothetical protein